MKGGGTDLEEGLDQEGGFGRSAKIGEIRNDFGRGYHPSHYPYRESFPR